MSDILSFLNLFELIIAFAMLIVIFILRHKPWNAHVLLAMTISMFILNVIQLVLELKLERIFLITIFSILIWIFDSVLIARQIHRRKKLRKLLKECEELKKSLDSIFLEE